MAKETSNGIIPRFRLMITMGIMLVASVVFLVRLFSLQIMQGEEYSELAASNRLSRANIPAPRGVMYDRNGYQLVRNIPSYSVYVTPAYLPDSEAEREAIFRRLSELTGVPVDKEGEPAAPCVPGRGILQLVTEGETNRPYDAWPIACDVDEEIARVAQQLQVDMPGVSVDALPARDYTTGELTAALIGYMGPIPQLLKDYFEDKGFDSSRDKVGYSGVEGWYQDLLAGQNGQKLVEVDVAGMRIREVGSVVRPLPGSNLRLTIDTRLQAAAETALRNRIDFMNRYAGERRVPLGAAIAMNPQTGEILAMVSLPTYENNRFARFIPEDYYNQIIQDARGKPLINHAISLEQPPGSTFKVVTSVGVLNEGVVRPNQSIFDPGKITIANTYFPNDPGKAKDFVCWKEEGHRDIDFIHALAFSCNVYFYKVGGGFPGEVPGDGLGIDRIGIYAQALGYGHRLGIDLPGEEDGLVPDRDWKRIHRGENWSKGDTYNAATGQGFVLSTPLQVLNAVSTVANGGRVMWPHIVNEVLDGEGNVVEQYQPCVLWDISDGIVTPLDEIGANCNIPEDVLERVVENRRETPDVNVEPWVIRLLQEGMHLVTTEGTAHNRADLSNISSGGKTGTGEFCDEVAREQNLCKPGNWPTHSWYVGYAPAENPEIAVVAFVYNGGEGAVTSGPIVREILTTYFQLKSISVAGPP